MAANRNLQARLRQTSWSSFLLATLLSIGGAEAHLLTIINPDPNTPVNAKSQPEEFLYINSKQENDDPVIEYQATTPPKDFPKDRQFELVPFLFDKNYPNPRMVVFYAHWCGHCKHFKPKYIEFARSMQQMVEQRNNETKRRNGDNYSEGDLMHFESIAVSCVPYKALCKNQTTRGYPTIHLYPAYSTEGKNVNQGQVHPMQVMRMLGLSMNGEKLSDGVIVQAPPSQAKKTGDVLRKSISRLRGTSGIPTLADIYHDAYASLVFTFRDAVFATIGDGQKLEGDKRDALQHFLILLQSTSPPTAMWHPLVEEILNSYNDVTSNETIWTTTIDKHYPGTIEWTTFCSFGYTCGLWQLFHIITVGTVEFNKFVSPQLQYENLLGPAQVADQLRDFISQYFMCDECRENFLVDYEACAYDRCRTLASKPDWEHRLNPPQTVDDWKTLPLWLSQTHNGVSARLRAETKSSSALQDVLWPPKAQCPACWSEDVDNKKDEGITYRADADGNKETMPIWNADPVYQHLRMTYWPNDSELLEMRRKLTPLPQSRPLTPLIAVAAIVCSVLVWYRHRRIKFVQKGMHKDA